MLGELTSIADIRSDMDVPSYPCAQNTSIARRRAAARSKLRGRPRSVMNKLLFCVDRQINILIEVRREIIFCIDRHIKEN